MSKVKSYVERGKASLLQTNLPHVVSVDVRESDQLDVKHLFCGARSLLIDERSGHIVARGVNKFRDYTEVDTLLVNSNKMKHDLNLYNIFSQQSLWEQCQVWALRKMAGFIVTLFALDANELHVMSKHATDGPHVQIAKQILNILLSVEEQKVIALDLFTHSASVCCECVAPVDDDQHPVMEDDTFHNQLVIFAIQQAHEVMELALPYAQVMTWATKWKLPCAPAQRLQSLEDLSSLVRAVRHWDDAFLFNANNSIVEPSSSQQAQRATSTRVTARTTITWEHEATNTAKLTEMQSKILLCPAFCDDRNNNDKGDAKSNLTMHSNATFKPHFAEGIVLLLETNLEVDTSLTFKRPIRLKIKTPCYITLRSLRSLLSGDSHPRIMLFHAVITQWAKQRRSILELQDQEMEFTREYSRSATKFETEHVPTQLFLEKQKLKLHEEECELNERSKSSWAWLQNFVAKHGVWWLYKEFVHDMMLLSKAQQRPRRNAIDTIGNAFMKLIRFSEVTLNTTFNTCPLTVVVMCGLPGSGKSTLSATLLECAELAEHFDFAILLSRDDITKHVKAKYKITETSSKHKQRRVGKLVHYATRAALNSVIEYTHILHVCNNLFSANLSCNWNSNVSNNGDSIIDIDNNESFKEKRSKPGLLIYDACNATRSTRRAWRRLLPQKLVNYTLIYLSCNESTNTKSKAHIAPNAPNNNKNSMNSTKPNYFSDACTSHELQDESNSETDVHEPNTTCHRTLCSKRANVESLQFLLSRMNARANHSVITNSNVAQRALYNVWRKFEPPLCDNESLDQQQQQHLEEEKKMKQTLEKCLHFDTRHTSVEKIAHDVCTHIIISTSHLPHAPSSSLHTRTNIHTRLVKILDVQQIASMVEEWKRTLIRSLLGDNDDLVNDTMELLTNTRLSSSLPLSHQREKRSSKENENKVVVAIHLEVTHEQIWHVVSLLLSNVLQTEHPSFTLASNNGQETQLCQKETQHKEEQHGVTTATRKRNRRTDAFTSSSSLLSLLHRCHAIVYSALPWGVLRRRHEPIMQNKEEEENALSINWLEENTESNTFACSLIAGHNRWLRGWLFHSDATEFTCHTFDSDVPFKKRICKENSTKNEEEYEKVTNVCHHSRKNDHEYSEKAIYKNSNVDNCESSDNGDSSTNILEHKICGALHDRFPIEPNELHVTLLHEEESTQLREPSGQDSKEWQGRSSYNSNSCPKRDVVRNRVVELEHKIGLPCGARVRVELNELLIDRFAICFRATLPDLDERRVQWSASELHEKTAESKLDKNINNNDGANHATKFVNDDKYNRATPLHMTVATSPRVKAQYCGRLFDLCDQYEKENVELAFNKSVVNDGTVVRSRSKFHNFIRLRLNKPLYLSGRIVHDM